MSYDLNMKININILSILLSKQCTFIVNMWWVLRKHDSRLVLASRRTIPQYGQFHSVRMPLVMESNVPWLAGDRLEERKIPRRETFRSPSCSLSLMRNAALDKRTTDREVSSLEWIVLSIPPENRACDVSTASFLTQEVVIVKERIIPILIKDFDTVRLYTALVPS